MQIEKILVSDFKRLTSVEIDLAPINIIVGGNNAGKSSVLQAIHFAVAASVSSREQRETTFAADILTFVPAEDFTDLRHGQPYQNAADQPFSGVQFFSTVGEERQDYKIGIRRGRNYGNISCDRSGNFPQLGSRITDPDRPFSIYVPGLAGVPQYEDFKPKRSVVKGVASGDANLYLRNVLFLLKKVEKIDVLCTWMNKLFPGFQISVNFDPEKDIRIKVSVFINGHQCSLELAGTGVQQALQIFSYVCLFEPLLLLLDEPDSHLHPTNQFALAEALRIVVSESATRVIASTHSKHLVDALYEEANFIWLKEGQVFEQGSEIPRLPMLMDLGALDSFDKIGAGQIDYIILSEDTATAPLKNLLWSSGFQHDRTAIFSYKTSTALYSAYLLVDFIKNIAPRTKVIIHRDRDFMTPEEVNFVSEKIRSQGAIPFITDNCDIEAYYCNPAHVSTVLEAPLDEVTQWIQELIDKETISITHSFTTKRQEIRQLFYKRGQIEGDPIDSLRLLGATPFDISKMVGKTLLKKIRGEMHSKFGRTSDLIRATAHTAVPQLIAARN